MMLLPARNIVIPIRFQSLYILMVLVFQNLLAAKVYRSNCRRDVMFKATDRDKKLTLNPQKILSTVSASRLPLCARQCTSTFNCRSINYKRAQAANCQILDIDKSNASVVVENAVGWVHYDPVSQVSF